MISRHPNHNRKSPLRHRQRSVMSRLKLIMSGVVVLAMGFSLEASSCLPGKPEIDPLSAVQQNRDVMDAEVGTVVGGDCGEVHSGRPIASECVIEIPPFRSNTGFSIRRPDHFQGSLFAIAYVTDNLDGILRIPSGFPSRLENLLPNSRVRCFPCLHPGAKEGIHIVLSLPAKRGLFLNLLEAAPVQGHQALLQPPARVFRSFQGIVVKRCVGPRIYVEWNELVEVLMDGTTRSCRSLLGLPDSH
jgi:hypothetical protein